VVPIEEIVGTTRNPTQNTADFLPLPGLRGRNWAARWQRILDATRDLVVLPAVDLIRISDEYYVADGHNRVAAALQAGAVAIDADVTELVLPGTATQRPPESGESVHHDAASLLLGANELRDAVAGRSGRTHELRSSVDQLRREELARPAETASTPGNEPAPGEEPSADHDEPAPGEEPSADHDEPTEPAGA
jgi:hypothetical protein